MARIKPRTPPGTLELLPLEQVAFQQMLDTIRRNFERFGFVPVETPVMEYADVLLTKSGGETERQVYFMHSTGHFQGLRRAMSDLSDRVKMLKDFDYESARMNEMAMRFDLTVPLARYVAEHERELTFPFRRYQIQRVYRGESAQRGRFREFYQCDIDVIGKDSLSVRYDAELPAVIHAVFSELAIGPFTIQLNNRKLIRGFFESIGIADGEQQTLVLREVDKLDKKGAAAVRASLMDKPFELAADVADRIMAFAAVKSTSHADAVARIDALGTPNESLRQGASELKEVLALVHALGVPESGYCVNFSIARGLDYYTGTVYETTLDDYPQIGSICSGGRYEDLASHYTSSKLPGVGISIGLTRLFWQLREAGLLKGVASSVKALVTNMEDAQLPEYLKLASELRDAGIATEAQLEPRKLGKQFQYADKAGIRFVLVLGPDEIAKGVVTVKDLRGEGQSEVARGDLAGWIRARLN